MSEKHLVDRLIPDELAGLRLDQALAAMLPEYSRSRLKGWIESGRIHLNGIIPKPRHKVDGGERVKIETAPESLTEDKPEVIALDVRYEDEHVLVLNKPPGRVVHPAAGNRDGTVLNALLHHAPQLAALPRAGIVHRLDKDTSGLMVVAKTPVAHVKLVAALAEHAVGREYLALVQGELIAGGCVEAPIGRHPKDRKRMAVVSGGKPAVSHYRIEERFVGHTLLRVSLETGRTHQIRVHMSHLRHPIVGDPVYGGRLRLPPAAGASLTELLRGFNRQALHATRLDLNHPATGEAMFWEAAMPDDMQMLISGLRAHAAKAHEAK